MVCWRVYRPSRVGKYRVGGKRCIHINSVFYDDDCDKEYVRRSLIGHDGYPADIIVVKEKRS